MGMGAAYASGVAAITEAQGDINGSTQAMADAAEIGDTPGMITASNGVNQAWVRMSTAVGTNSKNQDGFTDYARNVIPK